MWEKRFEVYKEQFGMSDLLEKAMIIEFKQELANRDAQWEKLLTDNVILTKGGTYLLEYDFIKKIKEKLNEQKSR